jgi:hypothetical protein
MLISFPTNHPCIDLHYIWLLDKSDSMRSFLDIKINREAGREGRRGHQNPKLAPWTKFKVGQIWAPREGRDPEIDQGVKRAESGGKLRTIRRPFHPDVQFLPHSQS